MACVTFTNCSNSVCADTHIVCYAVNCALEHPDMCTCCTLRMPALCTHAGMPPAHATSKSPKGLHTLMLAPLAYLRQAERKQ
jgi:hypothetical protein